MKAIIGWRLTLSEVSNLKNRYEMDFSDYKHSGVIWVYTTGEEPK
jgi:hypothetical protein